MMTNQSAKQILLSFNGFQDPFTTTRDYKQVDGPILSLLGQKEYELHFDGAFLFHTPDFEDKASSTCSEIRSRFSMDAENFPIESLDPTDYNAILRGLRQKFSRISREYGKAEFTIFVSPGTPQMHACWLMLSASGEIPARRLLQLRQGGTSLPGQKPVVEHKVQSLPRIPARETAALLPPRADRAKIEEALRESKIVGGNPLLLNALEDAVRFADADGPILIRGETGTGKELLAKFIHMVSQRNAMPFVPINCGAITASLVESELFGHEKGAFTGAVRSRPGAFDMADGGTIFLDEIGDLPQDLQVKLLRVVQEGQVKPVGADKHHDVNVRLISATHRDLEQLIRNQSFREDLYYRLNMFEIHLPALRERITDVGLIANEILGSLNRKYNGNARFLSDALQQLQNHRWPGNIRELINVVERAYCYAKDMSEIIDSKLIKRMIKRPYDADPLCLPIPHEGFDMRNAISRVEYHLYDLAIQMAGGVNKKAAALLGVSDSMIGKHLARKKIANPDSK